MLKQKYGDVSYRVEMRHNFYSIKSEKPIDIALLRG
ncbi:hypothetical protein GQ607_003995 [Colletotrichum asianum]|uniref:Uncharacterized protein n=1 Tax=Colletotrichum asianum TaxID=702518 RepID=A0A8H3ZR09_9PEZI|nr:hypothetical protein GQ607_003995 [Colletotrichum asianum]